MADVGGDPARSDRQGDGPGWLQEWMQSRDVSVSVLPDGAILFIELIVIAVVVLLFAVGSGALWGQPMVGDMCPGTTKADVLRFTQGIGFRGWVAALAVTVALAVAVFVATLAPFIRAFRDCKPLTRITSIAFYVLVAWTIYEIPRRLNNLGCIPLPVYHGRLDVVFGLILVCTAPAFLALVIIPVGLRDTDPGSDGVVTRLLMTGLNLRQLLASLALVIAGATVGTSLLREALISYDSKVYSPEFPPQNVLFYGLFFTLLLALVYFPAYLIWQEQARRLVDFMHPLPDKGPPGSALINERKSLESLLGLTASAAGTFTTAFGLLAPLAASALVALITGSG